MGEPLSTVNYTYDGIWKDKLTSYGNTAITTDATGNPLNYVGSNVFNTDISGTLEWNGRQLQAVQLEDRGYKYTYDSNGLRTSMAQYSHSGEFEAMYRYFWEGNRLAGYLVSDENGDIVYTIKMMYDDAGESIGYIFVNMEEDIQKVLYFEKNLQGDILSVKDKEGNKFVSYTYDAWGNISSEFYGNDLSEGVESILILLLTPITYRGYMYDPFTGLYYLQSRYYNPTYGRFLNADSILKTGEVLGANIFAYCGNNPINFVDYGGREAQEDTEQTQKAIANIFISLIMYTILKQVLADNELEYILNLNLGATETKFETAGIYNFMLEFVDTSYDYKYVKYLVSYGFGTVEQWYAFYDFQKNSKVNAIANSLYNEFFSFLLNSVFGFLGSITETLTIFLDVEMDAFKLDELEESLRYRNSNELLFRVHSIEIYHTHFDGTIYYEQIISHPINYFF